MGFKFHGCPLSWGKTEVIRSHYFRLLMTLSGHSQLTKK